MELSRVHILNYRSIERCTIEFTPRCRILVGINEAGKSNILKAMALLDDRTKSTPQDVRVPRKSEGSPDEAEVTFVFSLTDSEKEALYQTILAKVIVQSEAAPFAAADGNTVTLREFVFRHAVPIYWADLIKSTKHHGGFKLLSTWRLVGRWRSLRKGASPENTVVDSRGRPVTLDSTVVVHDSYSGVEDDANFADIECSRVYSMLISQLADLGTKSHPSVLFWRFQDSMVLPSSISAEAFSESPDTCVPLKNMFRLAKVKDIPKEFELEQARGAAGMRNLLERVAHAATQHMRRVWREYKFVKFALWPDGPNIGAGIKDAHNHFDMAQRSDGFRRFASFLLLVSAQARQGDLKGSLLILDEPDVSLHPKGARCLRDELIQLSRDCAVIYATHNTAMIDREEIGRHIIVEKSSESTKCRSVTTSNIADEEVLFNALGTSVFECLRERNIVFEGWRDKRLFQVAKRALPGKRPDLVDAAEAIGMCHAYGAKDIPRVCAVVELASRGAIVVSDGDAVAKEAEKRCREGGMKGPWLRYDHIHPGVVTMEDFIEVEEVLRCFESAKRRLGVQVEYGQQQVASGSGVMASMRESLLSQGVSKEITQQVLEATKSKLCEELRPERVRTTYFDFIGRVLKAAGAL